MLETEGAANGLYNARYDIPAQFFVILLCSLLSVPPAYIVYRDYLQQLIVIHLVTKTLN